MPTPPAPSSLPVPLPVPLREARGLASRTLSRLERCPEALRLAVTGEVRRMEPWISRVDLLATAHAAGPLLDALAGAPYVAEVLERTPTAATVRTRDGVRLRLEVLEQEGRFGAALLRTTGPAGYVWSLHTLARAQRLTWEADTLAERGEPRGGPEEVEVFAALGLPWQPPERRGRGSLEEGVPSGLLEMRDVVGIAGLHGSTAEERFAAEELAQRAQREGYAWALVDDESALAGGDAESGYPVLESQGIQTLTANVVRVGRGGEFRHVREADAYGSVCLAYLDADAPTDPTWLTDLLVKAARHRPVDVVALRVPEMPPPDRCLLDVPRLLQACAETGVALGVPPPPHHPDPEPGLLEAAAARGIPLLLLAEARDLSSVDDLILAVGLARRAGVPRSLVLNTFDRAGFEAWRGVRRGRSGHLA